MIESPFLTLVAGEALAAHRRVKLSGTTVVYADSGQRGIGVTAFAVSSGDDVTIRLDNAGGTVEMTASGAITAGNYAYAADDGKVAATGSMAVAQALVTTTADGDIFEAVALRDLLADVSKIWVDPNGDDDASGSLLDPVKTITKALTLVTTARKTIMVMPGSYTETLSLTWPSIGGVSINGVLGHGDGVTIRGTAGQTQVISIDPTVQTATFEATLSNATVSAPDGVIGIKFNNTNVGRKINLYLYNAPIENDTETDKAIDVVHTVTTEAMRIYASGQRSIVEGLLYIAPKNVDDRFTFDNYQFDGGMQFGTTTIASVTTFKECILKKNGGVGGQDTQIITLIGCVSLTGSTYGAAALADVAANAAEVILSLS